MNSRKILIVASMSLSLVIALASSSPAASLSWNSTAPTVDGADISQYTGVAADADNIAGGDDQGTYVAIGRDGVGQTFTTGSNLAGYQLNAVTLQHVIYETFWSLDTGWNGYNGGSFQVEIGTINAGVFSAIASENAIMDASAPANMNPGTGTGQFATMTLDSSVALSANTEYAFVVYSSNDGVTDISNGPYFETNGDGTTSDNYTAGEAFSLAAAGGSFPSVTTDVVDRTGDRVFHLDMTAVPEPASVCLLGLAALATLGFRRNT